MGKSVSDVGAVLGILEAITGDVGASVDKTG